MKVNASDRRAEHAARISALRDNILTTYRARTRKSEALYKRASQSLAGGVSGNLRHFDPYPLYMTHGDGSSMVDVDGHRYIDCFLGNGPMLLGHRHPAMMDGIVQQLGRRGSLVINPDLMVECAELLQALVPCAERIRFLNSGTEGTMMAVRFARAYAQRNKIVKFYGHYHGQDDQFLIGRGLSRSLVSGGIPIDSVANTILLEYGDSVALDRTLTEDQDIAAIILDPAMQTGGVWPADKSYIDEVRRLTAERNVVLIFDEVLTGFRLGPGGAQQHYGVTPDMAVFSKAFAAGEKLAAVVGRKDVMDVVVPKDPSSGFAAGGNSVFQSGTGNDGTAALAAAISAMTLYRELWRNGGYERLDQLSRSLQLGITKAFADRGLRCHINRWGSMQKIFLTEREPGSFRQFQGLDNSLRTVFLLGLINEGVFMMPTEGNIFLSFAHTENDVTTILEKTADVLDRYQFEEFA